MKKINWKKISFYTYIFGFELRLGLDRSSDAICISQLNSILYNCFMIEQKPRGY